MRKILIFNHFTHGEAKNIFLTARQYLINRLKSYFRRQNSIGLEQAMVRVEWPFPKILELSFGGVQLPPSGSY